MGERFGRGGPRRVLYAYWGVVGISGAGLSALWAADRCATAETGIDAVAAVLIAAAAASALTVWCAALGTVDLMSSRLPNRLTLPGAGIILAGASAAGQGRAALYGAFLLGAVYLAAHLARPSAMGAGDVKLALGLGAATALGGGHAWVLAAAGAPLLTAAVGVCSRSIARVRARGGDCGCVPRIAPAHGDVATFPHGPSMCIASVVGLLAGG